MDYQTLGKNIREYRKNQKLTQENLSEIANISPVFLSQIENGKKIPSLETAYNIASALNVSIDTLLSDKSVNNYEEQIQLLLKKRTQKETLFILNSVRFLLSNLDSNSLK